MDSSRKMEQDDRCEERPRRKPPPPAAAAAPARRDNPSEYEARTSSRAQASAGKANKGRAPRKGSSVARSAAAPVSSSASASGSESRPRNVAVAAAAHAPADRNASITSSSTPSSSKKRPGRKRMRTDEEGVEQKMPHQKRWDEMYERLKIYKAKFGHCNVPNRYNDDTQLGSWVSAQRRQFRIITQGEHGSAALTPDRANKLIALGFQWSTTNPHHTPWEIRYESLKKFVKRFGHAEVPMRWSEDAKLSHWVSKQRHDFKLRQEGKSARMTDEKIRLLNAVGFCWEGSRRSIQEKVQAINPSVSSSDGSQSSSMNTASGPAVAATDFARGFVPSVSQQSASLPRFPLQQNVSETSSAAQQQQPVDPLVSFNYSQQQQPTAAQPDLQQLLASLGGGGSNNQGLLQNMATHPGNTSVSIQQLVPLLNVIHQLLSVANRPAAPLTPSLEQVVASLIMGGQQQQQSPFQGNSLAFNPSAAAAGGGNANLVQQLSSLLVSQAMQVPSVQQSLQQAALQHALGGAMIMQQQQQQPPQDSSNPSSNIDAATSASVGQPTSQQQQQQQQQQQLLLVVPLNNGAAAQPSILAASSGQFPANFSNATTSPAGETPTRGRGEAVSISAPPAFLGVSSPASGDGGSGESGDSDDGPAMPPLSSFNQQQHQNDSTAPGPSREEPATREGSSDGDQQQERQIHEGTNANGVGKDATASSQRASGV